MVINRYEDNIKFKNLLVTQFFLQEICLVICITYFISLFLYDIYLFKPGLHWDSFFQINSILAWVSGAITRHRIIKLSAELLRVLGDLWSVYSGVLIAMTTNTINTIPLKFKCKANGDFIGLMRVYPADCDVDWGSGSVADKW